jgi:hypothetical protein
VPERVVRGVRNLAGRRRKLAKNRPIADDLRVVADIRGGWHIADQRAKISKPSDIVELLAMTRATPTPSPRPPACLRQQA